MDSNTDRQTVISVSQISRKHIIVRHRQKATDTVEQEIIRDGQIAM